MITMTCATVYIIENDTYSVWHSSGVIRPNAHPDMATLTYERKVKNPHSLMVKLASLPGVHAEYHNNYATFCFESMVW